MNKTEEQAREFLIKEGFNGLAKHGLTAKLMMDFANSQPPRLDLKYNERLEVVEIDEDGEAYTDTEHGRYFYEPEQAKTLPEWAEVFREQLQQAQAENERLNRDDSYDSDSADIIY